MSGIQFNIDCLPKLRFLDLEFNDIKGLSIEDRQTLDKYAATHNHNLTVDLTDNSLIGGCSSLYSWVQASKVTYNNCHLMMKH